jgi:hypothetical protein
VIAALSVLGAIVLVLLWFLWLQHREAAKIAFLSTEFLQERIRELDKERESLITRIQAWDPNPVDVKQEPARRPRAAGIEDVVEEEPQNEADKRGLKPNTAGGWLDEYGHLYTEFEAYDDWIVFRDKNRLPKDADPLDFVSK